MWIYCRNDKSYVSLVLKFSFVLNLTDWLTPWEDRVLPSSEANSRSATQIFSFYGTWIFITVFTRPRHLSLSWARCIQSRPFQAISFEIHSYIILPSTPRSFDQNFVYVSRLSHACYMPLPSYPPWLDYPDNIWWTVQVMKFLIMQPSPASCHFLFLRSKYSLHHPPLTLETAAAIFTTKLLKIDLHWRYLWWFSWH